MLNGVGDYLDSSKDDLYSQEIKGKHEPKERDRGKGAREGE